MNGLKVNLIKSNSKQNVLKEKSRTKPGSFLQVCSRYVENKKVILLLDLKCEDTTSRAALDERSLTARHEEEDQKNVLWPLNIHLHNI